MSPSSEPCALQGADVAALSQHGDFGGIAARPMGYTDCSEVERIEREAYEFPWTLRNFASSIRAGHDAWLFGLASNRNLPAGPPCGYAVLMWAPEEVHLLNITVMPRLQGQGIGAMILAWLFDDTVRRGARRMLLEVRPSNMRAIALYENRGFTRIGLRRGYYPAGRLRREDAIVMLRLLP